MELKMNVVIPMAGRGSRFAGFSDLPKPLITITPNNEYRGLRMVEAAIKSLCIDANYIFIVRDYDEHKQAYDMIFDRTTASYDIVSVPGNKVTDGAACTALLAADHINNDWPVLFVNCDQIMHNWNAQHFLERVSVPNSSGGIVTFKSDNPGASYAVIEDGLITEVAEKQLISDNATAGLYFWKRGKDFCYYADAMIQLESNKVNGEFYLCPVYSEALRDGHKFVAYDLDEHGGQVCLIGTPDELTMYEGEVVAC